MSEIKIEKGVPIPEGAKLNKWPFASMEIGDSFEWPQSKASKLYTAASAHRARNPPFKFITKRVREGIIRLWRTE